MTSNLIRFVGLLCPLFLIAGCGSSGQQRTVGLLGDRLQQRLAPDIAAGRAALEPLPDGARVTLLRPSLFAETPDALDDRDNDVRASVVEGLLDPALMRIQVTDSSALPDSRRLVRVRNVSQYFTAYGLGPSLQPTEPLQAVPPASAGAPAAGLVISIGVQCPAYHNGFGYGYGSGAARPACD